MQQETTEDKRISLDNNDVALGHSDGPILIYDAVLPTLFNYFDDNNNYDQDQLLFCVYLTGI